MKDARRQTRQKLIETAFAVGKCSCFLGSVREIESTEAAEEGLHVALLQQIDGDVPVPLAAVSEFVKGVAGFAGGEDLKPVRLGDRNRFAPLVEADDDVAAAVLEVERVGVALRAKAEDGQGLALEKFQVSVFIRKYFCGHRMEYV